MKNWVHWQHYRGTIPYVDRQGTAYTIQAPDAGGEDAAAKVRAVAEEIAGVKFVPKNKPLGFKE